MLKNLKINAFLEGVGRGVAQLSGDLNGFNEGYGGSDWGRSENLHTLMIKAHASKASFDI